MKATPEGVFMLELRPASDEVMAHCWGNLSNFQRIATVLKLPNFSEETLTELASILENREAAQLVLVCVRVGEYGDQHRHWAERRAVTELLLRDGIHLPKGKRTRPGFSEFVELAAPMLIYFGLQPSASERSKLVRALRVIADGLGIPCDPREEIRRLKRRDKADRAAQETLARQLVADAFRKAFSQENAYPPPKVND